MGWWAEDVDAETWRVTDGTSEFFTAEVEAAESLARLLDNVGGLDGPSALSMEAVRRQRDLSRWTFRADTTAGVIDHLRKGLDAVASSPDELSGWVDIIRLAIDGGRRSGHGPQELLEALEAEQTSNPGPARGPTPDGPTT